MWLNQLSKRWLGLSATRDLGIDSMAMIDINIALEERFKFTMPDFAEPNEINLETVADLVAFVAARSADATPTRGRS